MAPSKEKLQNNFEGPQEIRLQGQTKGGRDCFRNSDQSTQKERNPAEINTLRSTNMTRKSIPNWDNRASKQIVREVIAHEIKQHTPNPSGNRIFVMPGGSMQCVKTFERAGVNALEYVGVEKEKSEEEKLRTNLQNAPQALREKCKFLPKTLNSLWTADIDSRARDKAQIAKGFHVIYLDFMCGFARHAKSTIYDICGSPEVLQHANEPGKSTLLYLTWNPTEILLNSKDPERILLQKCRNQHPENNQLSAQGHQSLHLDYFLGVEGLICQLLQIVGMSAKSTHRIVYREDGANRAIMLSMGIKISKDKPASRTSQKSPIVYLGLNNQTWNPESLTQIDTWQRSGAITEQQIPGRFQINETIRHLQSVLGKTPEEISRITRECKIPLSPANVQTAIRNKTSQKTQKLPSVTRLANFTKFLLENSEDQEIPLETLHHLLGEAFNIPTKNRGFKFQEEVQKARYQLTNAGITQSARKNQPVKLAKYQPKPKSSPSRLQWDEETYQEIHNAMMETNSIQEAASQMGITHQELYNFLKSANLETDPKDWQSKFPQSPAEKPSLALADAVIASIKMLCLEANPKSKPELQTLVAQAKRLEAHYPQKFNGVIKKANKLIATKQTAQPV